MKFVNVSWIIISEVSSLPGELGIRVAPSGRFPSVLVDCFFDDRNLRTFHCSSNNIVWTPLGVEHFWAVLRLHDKLCKPPVFTSYPHGQVFCCSQALSPSRYRFVAKYQSINQCYQRAICRSPECGYGADWTRALSTSEECFDGMSASWISVTGRCHTSVYAEVRAVMGVTHLN